VEGNETGEAKANCTPQSASPPAIFASTAAFDRSAGRVWYPIQIDRWTDGAPWIRRWAYYGCVSTDL